MLAGSDKEHVRLEIMLYERRNPLKPRAGVGEGQGERVGAASGGGKMRSIEVLLRARWAAWEVSEVVSPFTKADHIWATWKNQGHFCLVESEIWFAFLSVWGTEL